MNRLIPPKTRHVRPAYRTLSLCLALLVVFSGLAAMRAHANSAPKEIYGPDYRVEVVDEPDAALVKQSQAVGGLVLRSYLAQQSNGNYLLHPRELTIRADNGDSYPMCPEEPFADQPVLPFCTAFLVGPDILVTAGHCMDFRPPEDLAVVFGYQVNEAGSVPAILPTSHVYFVKKVLHTVFTPSNDFAILQLDRRAPETRTPLNFRRAGRVQTNTPIGVIGHPLGLPMKIAFGEESVVYDNRFANYFIANFDASAGNSGSPVINQLTGVVEGIYINSTVDDLVLNETGCWEQNRVPLDEAGQGVYRVTLIADLLEQALADSDEAWEAAANKAIPACGSPSDSDEADAAASFGTVLLLIGLLLFLHRHTNRLKTDKNNP